MKRFLFCLFVFYLYVSTALAQPYILTNPCKNCEELTVYVDNEMVIIEKEPNDSFVIDIKEDLRIWNPGVYKIVLYGDDGANLSQYGTAFYLIVKKQGNNVQYKIEPFQNHPEDVNYQDRFVKDELEVSIPIQPNNKGKKKGFFNFFKMFF